MKQEAIMAPSRGVVVVTFVRQTNSTEWCVMTWICLKSLPWIPSRRKLTRCLGASPRKVALSLIVFCFPLADCEKDGFCNSFSKRYASFNGCPCSQSGAAHFVSFHAVECLLVELNSPDSLTPLGEKFFGVVLNPWRYVWNVFPAINRVKYWLTRIPSNTRPL